MPLNVLLIYKIVVLIKRIKKRVRRRLLMSSQCALLICPTVLLIKRIFSPRRMIYNIWAMETEVII